MNFGVKTIAVLAATLLLVGTEASVWAGQLYVGSATTDITPAGPVSVVGQMHIRISKSVESPLKAIALAIETRDGDKSLDQAILVSCDLISIRPAEMVAEIRSKIAERLPGFDARKVILNGTHTHTGPETRPDRPGIPADAVQPRDYAEFLVGQIVDVACKAWEQREKGKVSWGLGHAVVAYNRRAVFADGTAAMYGATNRPDFRRIEGPEDQGLEILFFWNQEDRLLATCINAAVPSQIVEGRVAVNADFWHQVRESLQAKYGEDLNVLAWCGAAGDQAPRPMFRKAAEDRMRKLRGVNQLEEAARRIVNAWEIVYEAVQKDKRSDVVFKHLVETVSLTPRLITQKEYDGIKKTLEADPERDNLNSPRLTYYQWMKRALARFENQQKGEIEPYEMELHVIRLGDVAIATNDFEYFTEFGVQIKARSKAIQSFIIQLAGPGTYVPTAIAVQGGGYSAIPQSNVVGPEGGQELVDKTVELMNSLWKK